MNFLLHLYLSGNDRPGILTGNLMGDFVKGRISGPEGEAGEHYPPDVRAGIMLHRRIDSFAQNHPLFRRSKMRIDSSYGLWRGVMVDLFYDHFLAAKWHEWSEMPLDGYLRLARTVVEANNRYLPVRMQALTPSIFEELIPSYREVEGIGWALERMAHRVRRANPLAGGESELERNYGGLLEDFCGFVQAAQLFSREFIDQYEAGAI